MMPFTRLRWNGFVHKSQGFSFSVRQGGLQVLQASHDAKVVVPELVRFLASMQEAGCCFP